MDENRTVEMVREISGDELLAAARWALRDDTVQRITIMTVNRAPIVDMPCGTASDGLLLPRLAAIGAIAATAPWFWVRVDRTAPPAAAEPVEETYVGEPW